MKDKRIQEFIEKVADIKKRWYVHFVSPAFLQELETPEEELVEAQR